MRLDVGSGHRKMDGFTGIDIIKFQDTDIQHDLTVFPWPIDDDCCTDIVMRYVWGCIDPKSRINLMNELWRIIKVDGKLVIQEQHMSTAAAYEDPTGYGGVSERTWAYFDDKYKRYEVYRPKPWIVIKAYLSEKPVLNLAVEMRAKK